MEVLTARAACVEKGPYRSHKRIFAKVGGPQISSANGKSANLRTYQIFEFASCGLTIKIADLLVHLCIFSTQSFTRELLRRILFLNCVLYIVHTQKHGSIVQYTTVSWSKHAADDLMSCAQLS